MYKYLLFDLDDTLLDFKKAEATAISEVLENFGVTPTKEIIELYSNINLSCWKRYEKGEITRDEIYENRVNMLGERLSVCFNVNEFTKMYCKLLSQQGQTFPYAHVLLSELKAKGYKMAAATNGTLVTQKGRIAASGLAEFFDLGIYISEEIGFKKPDPEFFEYILKTVGAHNKKEALVIGDSPSSDIAGAVAAGIDSCLVGKNSPEKVKPTYFAKRLEDVSSICGLVNIK